MSKWRGGEEEDKRKNSKWYWWLCISLIRIFRLYKYLILVYRNIILMCLQRFCMAIILCHYSYGYRQAGPLCDGPTKWAKMAAHKQLLHEYEYITWSDQVLTTFKEFSISVASALIFNEFKGNYKYRNKRNSGGMSSSSPAKGCQQQQPEIVGYAVGSWIIMKQTNGAA